MNQMIRDGLYKIAISLAHVWAWNKATPETFMEFFIYDHDINLELRGRRIKIRIEYEDWP